MTKRSERLIGSVCVVLVLIAVGHSCDRFGMGRGAGWGILARAVLAGLSAGLFYLGFRRLAHWTRRD